MTGTNNVSANRRLVLLKTMRQGGQELGQLLILEGPEKMFDCVTLQKADILKDGKYSVEPYLSPKSGKQVLLLRGTPGHSYIEIHIGNYLKDTAGCVLPGKFFTDLNNDKLLDVASSAATMAVILAWITVKTTITVKSV